MIYLQLLMSFLQVGLFSIGGGYAAIPLIKAQVIDCHGWITMNEFTDLVTIAEMTPGPIAVNSATFVGIRIAGIPGALVATAGCILPSLMIVSAFAFLYFRYKKLSAMQSVLNAMRPAVVALIASAAISILVNVIWNSSSISLSVSDMNFVGIALFATALAALRKTKINPILVILGTGGVGLISYCAIDFLT